MQSSIILESFPNELLLEVFAYLPSTDLLRGFHCMNFRFHHLIIHHLQSYNVNFSSASLSDLKFIGHKSLPILAKYVKSLTLSNGDNTPHQVYTLFHENALTLRQFHQLQRLSLCDVCSNDTMEEMMVEWSYLPNLTHLTLAGCYLKFDRMTGQRLIDTIWSLPKLVYCYLNIDLGHDNTVVPTAISTTLTYLFIWGREYGENDIHSLLQQTPYLQHFSVLLRERSEQRAIVEHSFSTMRRFRLEASQIDENRLSPFFRYMPNLCHLIIEVGLSRQPLDGYQWENLIRRYLPNLTRFQLNVSFKFDNTDKRRKEQIDSLLDSFRCPFWLEEHQWFVRCHWNPLQRSSTIHLYTLPYKVAEFQFNFPVVYKSTCPNDAIFLDYHHVTELKYESNGKRRFLSPQIRFPNVENLSIQFPIHDQFWSMIPNPQKVTSLTIFGDDKDVNITLVQIQNLIDHLPNLYSLTMAIKHVFQLVHTSIRRLDLRCSDFYLDNRQCLSLSRSVLGSQCEILHIYLFNGITVFELVESMKQLRLLTIESLYGEHLDENDDSFLSSLRSQLSPPFVIKRDDFFSNVIQMCIC
ncbi:unnamed protein product [Adineta ricciae]|uniref:F-box domain-containing protein n=1 Tax=Adineta ricciae TaxID=249248 RepID=A0A813P0B3_ADIRI|nr:unnamed protein product [Adineta ricciae]